MPTAESPQPFPSHSGFEAALAFIQCSVLDKNSNELNGYDLSPSPLVSLRNKSNSLDVLKVSKFDLRKI